MSDFNGPALNKEIARLTFPNIISNITIPLMGMADVAIAGHVGGDVAIGGLTIGTTIFNMIYWNCSFLRMAGSGVTAQNFGAKRHDECAATLIRIVSIALAISILLIAFRSPICNLSLDFIGGTQGSSLSARQYVMARFWAVPASVTLFALTGWLIGMQCPHIPMLVAIACNLVNVSVSYFLAVNKGLGIEGVAWGTVVAQYFGLLLTLSLIVMRFRRVIACASRNAVLRRNEIAKLLNVNRDIFLRTLCLVAVFTSFTSFSASFGEQALAANALILQFFTLFSYMTDGLAYAAESLIGRLLGEGNHALLRLAVRRITSAGFLTATLYTLAFTFGWSTIFTWFSPSPSTIDAAGECIGWAIAIPFCCFFAFIADGVMIGATQGTAMRNTMAASTLLFFATFFLLRPVLGVNALWLAFTIYMVARGVLLLPSVLTLCNGKVK